MTVDVSLLAGIALVWLTASALVTAAATGMCRSGHAEDVAHGWADR